MEKSDEAEGLRLIRQMASAGAIKHILDIYKAAGVPCGIYVEAVPGWIADEMKRLRAIEAEMKAMKAVEALE